jgi:hypothetical protein
MNIEITEEDKMTNLVMKCPVIWHINLAIRGWGKEEHCASSLKMYRFLLSCSFTKEL